MIFTRPGTNEDCSAKLLQEGCQETEEAWKGSRQAEDIDRAPRIGR